MRIGCLISALALLSACGDPLRDMPRLSDVDLAETDPVAQALPTEAEVAREGFFGTDAATGADKPDIVSTAPAKPQLTGFLGILQGVVADVSAAAVETQPTESTRPSEASDGVPETEVASLEPVDTQASTSASRGFWGQFGGTASRPSTGVDAQEVSYGTVLPFGTVTRVCDARRKPLGRKVETASARGYKLYDSNPGAAGQRTYYITGFADGCPRQLTAAHVVLGSPSFYELLHYGPAGAHLVTGETDRTYEKVKSRVCGARKGKPCGSKMSALERDTFFVNAYERVDDNTRWAEMLVHDSAVVATALKAN